MTDIARLGFRADTNELKDAKASLDQLVPSAQKAEKAVDQLAFDFIKMDTAAGKAARGASAASTGMHEAAAGAQRASTAAGSAATANDRLAGSAHRVAAGLSAVSPAAGSATSALNRLGAAANDNINRMQATPGNIAAQFQDIGVTAAAGMNPMIIALQQGTQLSAAMSGGIGNLLRGFGQLLNPVSLLTIGLVGLVAAGIQMVDWAEVGKDALYFLADAMEVIAPYAVGIAAALALIYAPAIITGIWSLATAFYGLAAGMLATIGIPAAIILGLAAVVAAAVYFRDELTQYFGFDIVAAAKTGVNYIIAFFVGGFNAIVATWRQLPAAIGDFVIQAANLTLGVIENMVNGTIARINMLTSMLPFGAGENLQMGMVSLGINNPLQGSARGVAQTWGKETQAALGVDHIGNALDYIGDKASDAADWLRSLADGLGKVEEKGKKAGGAERARRGRPEKSNDELFAEVLGSADDQLRGLVDASAQIGVYGEALERLRFEQELFNMAQDKGVKLTEDMANELRRRAAEMAAIAHDNVRSNMMEDARREHEDTMWALGRERGELMLTKEALAAYRFETEMLAEARRQNITLTPVEIAQMREYAKEHAATAEAIRKTQEALEFAQDTVRGFFRDWAEGVKEGQGLFEAFGNSVLNVLNRIFDRLLDAAINGLIDILTNALGAYLGGGGISSGRPSMPGMSHLAKGGAFTNGVFNSPTMFSFANGHAFGEMGEAGPEAVMPLRRGPDGSLGVQAHGSSGPGAVYVTVENSYTLTGAISSDDVIEITKRAAEETSEQLRRQVPEIIETFSRDGAMV